MGADNFLVTKIYYLQQTKNPQNSIDFPSRLEKTVYFNKRFKFRDFQSLLFYIFSIRRRLVESIDNKVNKKKKLSAFLPDRKCFGKWIVFGKSNEKVSLNKTDLIQSKIEFSFSQLFSMYFVIRLRLIQFSFSIRIGDLNKFLLFLELIFFNPTK